MADLFESATQGILVNEVGELIEELQLFQKNEKGYKEFQGGLEDWTGAEKAAKACESFKPDVEEEWISDNLVSCYNCRYRRWTIKSFSCISK